jgi:hypothetical protein
LCWECDRFQPRQQIGIAVVQNLAIRQIFLFGSFGANVIIFPVVFFLYIYRLNSINQLLRCYYLKKKGNCDDMSNNCRLQFRKWQLTNQCGRQWLLFGNVIDRWRPFYGICLEFSRPINVVSS